MKNVTIKTEYRDNSLKMEIPRNPQVLDILREKVTGFLDKKNINYEITTHVELVIYEITINIIEYSSRQYNQMNIILQLTLFGDYIEIDIKDYGKCFDLTKAEMPDVKQHFNSGEKHGLGIYIIRTLMDEVEYSYRDNTNHLILKKNLHGK